MMALLKEPKGLPQRHREHRDFNLDLELLIVRCHSIENYNGYLDFLRVLCASVADHAFFRRANDVWFDKLTTCHKRRVTNAVAAAHAGVWNQIWNAFLDPRI